MKQILQELDKELNELTSDKNEFEKLLEKIRNNKKEAVVKGDEDGAKIFWCCESIISICLGYLHVFELLRTKEYYNAWCKLEHIEIALKHLLRHFDFREKPFRLYLIEKYVTNLQILFPYNIFSSHESKYKEVRCSICDQIISIRRNCGHKVGEIYNGEMCARKITKLDLLAISIVQDPVNKYAVLFASNDGDDEKKDHYDYSLIEYFLTLIDSPDKNWELEIDNTPLPHTNFKNYNHQEKCPCGSSEIYKDCCLLNSGVKNVHYSILYYI